MFLVIKSKFAIEAGVSAAAVTLATKPGKPLCAALVDGKIDCYHPAAVAYLNKSKRNPGVKAGGKARKPRKTSVTAREQGRRANGSRSAGTNGKAPGVNGGAGRASDTNGNEYPPPGEPTDPNFPMEKIENMTVRELVRRFGTAESLTEWLKARKLITQITAQENSISERRGELVSREIVHTHIFGAIENAFSRLLQDAPRTIAARTIAANEAGEPLEDVENLVRELMESQIRTVKARSRKALENA